MIYVIWITLLPERERERETDRQTDRERAVYEVYGI